MANITDEEVVAFNNNEMRFYDEAIDNLRANLESVKVRWVNGINAKVPNDGTAVLEDERPADHPTNGGEMHKKIALMGAILNTINHGDHADALVGMQLGRVRSMKVRNTTR